MGMMSMSEYHVCAECTDFLGGGDWGLCCESAPYNFLCYDRTEVCERFKPGRHIEPIVAYLDKNGERRGFQSDDATLADCIEKAKELMNDGCPKAIVINHDPNRGCPALWMEES